MWWRFQSATFVYGSMAGGVFGVAALPGSSVRPYLRHLAYWRRLYPDVAVYGRMERPPSLEQLGAATATGTCSLLAAGTSTGVVVAALSPATTAGPLESESHTKKNKDTAGGTFSLPTALAAAYMTPAGTYVVTIASTDTDQARDIVVTVDASGGPSPTSTAAVQVRGIGAPNAYGPTLGPPTDIQPLGTTGRFLVTLPPCSVAQLEIHPGEAAP